MYKYIVHVLGDNAVAKDGCTSRYTWLYLTIIPRARMGSESMAREAEGRVGY